MSTIHTALKDAGVKLPPLNKRVWLWLKDHPHKTSADIALAINSHQADVSSVLGNLGKRSMVSVKKDYKPGGHTTVSFYSAVGKSFELLPIIKALAFVQTPPAEPIPEVPAIPITKESILDKLKVKDAFALYQELHAMFGGR